MTPVGIFIALFAIVVSMTMEHGHVASLIKISPLLLVVGGSLGATMAGFEMRRLRAVPRALRIVLKPRKGPDTRATIEALLAMAKEARSNPLVLEELETDDAFMKKGIQLIVSTSDPDRVYELMEAEIDGLRVRHQTATKFFSDMAGYSPTFGILGTVIGLISVLGQLSSPGKLGPAIAAAFTATLWGVLVGQRGLVAPVEQAPAALGRRGLLSRDGGRRIAHHAVERLDHGAQRPSGRVPSAVRA